MRIVEWLLLGCAVALTTLALLWDTAPEVRPRVVVSGEPIPVAKDIVAEGDETCNSVVDIKRISVSKPGTEDRTTWLVVNTPGQPGVDFICYRSGDFKRENFLTVGQRVKLDDWDAA